MMKDAALLAEGLCSGETERFVSRMFYAFSCAHAATSIWPSFRGGWPSSAFADGRDVIRLVPQATNGNIDQGLPSKVAK